MRRKARRNTPLSIQDNGAARDRGDLVMLMFGVESKAGSMSAVNAQLRQYMPGCTAHAPGESWLANKVILDSLAFTVSKPTGLKIQHSMA